MSGFMFDSEGEGSGAWIEINNLTVDSNGNVSLPSWERELK